MLLGAFACRVRWKSGGPVHRAATNGRKAPALGPLHSQTPCGGTLSYWVALELWPSADLALATDKALELTSLAHGYLEDARLVFS